MKRILHKFFIVVIALTFIYGCSDNESKLDGKVKLSLTDAPIDDQNVESVFITVTGIQYRKDDGQWLTFEEFEGPVTVDLLDLTEGKTLLLGEFSAGPGRYTGLRFMLDAAVDGANPGCYIAYKDGSEEPLFMPSGGQTGYKTIGEFTVPSNGTVEVTADFNVRKSVVVAGASGKFLLKPTIRIIVDNQAGEIDGTIAGMEEGMNLVVFAYENEVYTEEEAAEPSEEENRFPNAVSSDAVNEGAFVLPFLAPGTYDLVIVAYDAEGNFTEVKKVIEDVEVTSNELNSVDVELTTVE